MRSKKEVVCHDIPLDFIADLIKGHTVCLSTKGISTGEIRLSKDDRDAYEIEERLREIERYIESEI